MPEVSGESKVRAGDLSFVNSSELKSAIIALAGNPHVSRVAVGNKATCTSGHLRLGQLELYSRRSMCLVFKGYDSKAKIDLLVYLSDKSKEQEVVKHASAITVL